MFFNDVIPLGISLLKIDELLTIEEVPRFKHESFRVGRNDLTSFFVVMK